MRTKPRHARRRDFRLRGGTFSRLSARRTPPGGRPREWVTVTCVLRSSPLPSSKKGTANPPRMNPCVFDLKVCGSFPFSSSEKINIFSFVFVSARRLRYRMKVGSFPAPTSPRALTCKPIYSPQLDLVHSNPA